MHAASLAEINTPVADDDVLLPGVCCFARLGVRIDACPCLGWLVLGAVLVFSFTSAIRIHSSDRMHHWLGWREIEVAGRVTNDVSSSYFLHPYTVCVRIRRERFIYTLFHSTAQTGKQRSAYGEISRPNRARSLPRSREKKPWAWRGAMLMACLASYLPFLVIDRFLTN